MKIYIKNITTNLFILLLVCIPIFSFADNHEYSIDPEDAAWYAQYGAGGTDSGLVHCQEGCDFNDFLTLVNTVVDFVLIKMFLPIAAFMFVYAGFTIITAGGNTEKVKQGKKIFWHVVIGFAIAVAAWVIVHTFLAVLGYEDASWIGF